jgi:hypothetical protein
MPFRDGEGIPEPAGQQPIGAPEKTIGAEGDPAGQRDRNDSGTKPLQHWSGVRHDKD